MKNNSAISTDATTKIERMIHVYYNPRPTIKVCLKYMREEVQMLTLSQLVGKAIKTLSEEYNLPINMSKSEYGVYPASKTGTKRDGYPQLDNKLPISKIQMRRFFLQQQSKAFSLISTQFNLQKKYGIEKPIKKQGICCNFFSLLDA